jgi:zinc protease
MSLFEVDRSLPLVALSWAVPSGSELDPPGKEGLTRITLRLMRRTPRGRDADQTNELLDSLGANLTGEVSRTTTSLGGVVLRENLEAFAGLMRDVWESPGLSAAEFEQLKSECLAEWRESLDNDRTLAFRTLDRTLFGDHPASRPSGGTWASLSRIELGDVEAHAARLAQIAPRVLAAAGDFDPSFLEQYAREFSLGAPPVPPERAKEPELTLGRRLYFIDKPERSQSQIAIGGLGTHPRDADHFALVVGNTIFGGTFSARLSQEVRVKRGWSYGAYSYLSLERSRGTFSIWTFPEASDTPACLELVLAMIERWVEKGVSEAEVRRAKTYLKHSHVFSIDTAGKRIQQELDVHLYDWPVDYYARYLEGVASVSAEQINAALRQRIDPHSLAIAVVGTASSLFGELEKRIPGLERAEILPFDRPD